MNSSTNPQYTCDRCHQPYGVMTANADGLCPSCAKIETPNPTKHTPGPWQVEPRQNTTDTRNYWVTALKVEENPDDTRRVDVCRCYCISDDGQDWSESAANARLIASAPDLLAACETVVTQSKGDLSAEAFRDYVATICRAAIVKAEVQS